MKKYKSLFENGVSNNDILDFKQQYPSLSKKMTDNTIKKLIIDAWKDSLFVMFLEDMEKNVKNNKKIVSYEIWLRDK